MAQAFRVFKLACEDLKPYYFETATSKRVGDWLFRETVLGTALWRLRDICQASKQKPYQYLGRISIVPDRQINPAT